MKHTKLIRSGVLTLLMIAAASLQAATRDRDLDLDVSPPIVGGDSVWVVSTRGLGCSRCGEGLANAEVQRCYHDGSTSDASLDEFLDGDEPGMTTVVYVHGNRITAYDANQRGLRLYRLLTDDPHAPPLRLVIWSWPSNQICGQVRDVRTKAARTFSEACYLSEFLAALNPASQVSLVGYSFGARVVTGALADLAGGSVGGCDCPGPRYQGRSNMRVVLVGAAMHNYWLAPGGWHSAGWQFVDHMVLLYNCCDPVLRRYRLIDLRNRPQALGYRGLWNIPDDQNARFSQYNVCDEVGKTHSEAAYWDSPLVAEQAQRCANWLPMP